MGWRQSCVTGDASACTIARPVAPIIDGSPNTCYDEQMNAFDPSEFGFVRLRSFEFPGGVPVYEYANDSVVDGDPDFLRINAYLSKDGDFVTVWRGLLEPLFAESRLGFVDLPDDFDFHENYTEELFRGYIESQEAGRHVIKALRLDAASAQVLSAGTDGKLRCDVIEKH
jgi:hypothetical protein